MIDEVRSSIGDFFCTKKIYFKNEYSKVAEPSNPTK